MKRILSILLLFLLCVGLSGCFSMSAEDLLAQPELPQDAVQLQKQIDKQRVAGALLAPPVGGFNRQAIQKVDIDGSGVEDTAIFYRNPGENSLHIVFYRKTGDEYEPFAEIEGEGEDIESITYEDMNGDGIPEVIVGWQAGQGVLRALTIYTFQEGQMRQLLSASYSTFAMQDFDRDGCQQLLILRHDTVFENDEAVRVHMAELYAFNGKELEPVSQAPLSNGAESIWRVRTGLLSDGQPAVFVASHYDAGSVVTDIFAMQGGTLKNITRNDESGVSDQTVRRHLRPMGTDISGDGVLNIPDPIELPPYDPDSQAQDSPGTVIQWRTYNSWGHSQVEITTWHNYTDNWYLEIPESWLPNLVMTRSSHSAEEKGVIFALREEIGPPRELLVIHTLTGDNLSAKEGWVKLLTRPRTMVAAEILPGAVGPYHISEEELRIFWIPNEWITGELS